MNEDDRHFLDWEAHVFGYGYGDGECYTMPAVKAFMAAVPLDGPYNYRDLEEKLGKTTTWFMINILCHADILEYGASPRFAWLTKSGKALKEYLDTKTPEDLIKLWADNWDRTRCYPESCSCQGKYVEGRRCPNPFWS